MKILVLLFLVCSAAQAADVFPEGEYYGTGLKTFDNGATKDYEVWITSAANRLDFVYAFPNKEPLIFGLTLSFGKSGFFTVGSIGEGYCGKDTCHYSVKLGDAVEQWTYYFDGKNLKKTGSLVSPDKKNYWEETLARK